MSSTKFKIHPFGKYVLLEEVASGGMAIVYKALGKTLDGKNHYFAIKRVLPNYASDEEFISLLKDEARLMVQLNHPNIVSLIEFGKVDRDYYISMEYIDGTTLKGLIQKVFATGFPFTIDMATHIVREIATGLAYAHRKLDDEGNPMNIVHRDISPANILVSFEGEVKIADFGISKATTQSHFTQTGIIRGKTGYMSPEQTRSDIMIDNRSDLFSLGIIFYELLTGKKLFYAKSIPEAIRMVREGQIQPISDFRDDIPKELEKIMLKILQPKPEDRYQRAEDIADALNEFLTRFSPGGRPLRITHVDLIGFLNRFFSEEMELSTSAALSEGKLISESVSQAMDLQQSSVSRKMYEKSSTFAANPLFGVSAPVQPFVEEEEPKTQSKKKEDKTGRSKKIYTEDENKIIANSLGRASVGEVLLKKSTVDEVTQADGMPFKKYWKHAVGAILAIGLIFGGVTMFKNRGPKFRMVTITTEPGDAQVWIDGVLQNQNTPGEFKVPEDRENIVIGLQKKGYQLVQQNRKLTKGDQSITIELQSDQGVVADASTSKVQLRTEPSEVQVSIDGKPVEGVTPLEVDLEVGKTYTLKFEKEGYVPKETKLSIDTPGSLEKTVYLKAMSRREKVATSQPKTVITPPAKLGSPNNKVISPGSLSVTTVPWSYVYVDNQKMGETPVVGLSISPGKHRLRLANPQLSLKDKSVMIEIKENKHTRCTYEFDKDLLQCF